jgi:hypothetical protein
MLIERNYNKETRIDKAWYTSSNIVYSECIDHEDDFKTLKVVFKNGACYEYYKVSVQDYLMFMHGGLDGSNGKALNSFIKSKKYEYKRIDDKDLTQLNEELEKLTKEKQNKLINENNKKEPQESTL